MTDFRLFRIEFRAIHTVAVIKPRHSSWKPWTEFAARNMLMSTSKIHIEAVLIGAVVLTAWLRAISIVLVGGL